jgi:hypothetical protein
MTVSRRVGDGRPVTDVAPPPAPGDLSPDDVMITTPEAPPVEPASSPGSPLATPWLTGLARRVLWLVGRVAGWLVGRLAPGVGVRRTEEGISFALPISGVIAGIGNSLAIFLVAYLYLQFLVALARFEYFGPITNIEETAYSWNIGRNFAQYGFMRTLFLQDVSHSPFKEDHPYTYNHQPPGLDVITGLILRIFPENFRVLRLIFSLVFVVGMGVYFAFANLILRRYGAPIAGYTILFFSGWAMMQGFDKQTSYYHPLMIFGPLMLFYVAITRSSRLYFAGALLMTLAASFMMDYVVLAAMIWCWIFLALTKILPVTWKHASAFVAVCVLGVLLHLVQNMLFLGWPTFIQELTITIGNRAIGYPTMDQVRDFYAQIGLVHHGARPPEPGVLMHQLVRQLDFELSLPPGAAWTVLLLGVLSIGVLLAPRTRLIRRLGTIVVARGPWLDEAGYILRLWLWILATVTLANLMFPAYNQEVVLSGSGVPLYFKAIGTVALLAMAARVVLSILPREWPTLTVPWLKPAQAVAAGKPVTTSDISVAWEALRQSALLGAGLLVGLVLLIGLIGVATIGIRTSAVPREARIAFYMMALALIVLLALQIAPRLGAVRAVAWQGSNQTRVLTQDLWARSIGWLAAQRSFGRVLTLLVGVGARLAIVIVGGGLVYEAFSARLTELKQVDGAVAEMRYAKLADLKSFPGALFMTNINTPIIGFFARAPGYGVCELDSLPDAGGVNSQACRIDFQRRHAYWAAQPPRYFYFFRAPELFPGFADCLPGGTLQSVDRGGDDCVAREHDRLSERAEKIFDNGIFEVFDLTRAPLDAAERDPRVTAAPHLAVSRTFPRAILLGWAAVDDASEYRVEMKKSPSDDFQRVGTVPRGGTSLLVDNLDSATRYFFRMRSCTKRGCSPYTYIDGSTGT